MSHEAFLLNSAAGGIGIPSLHYFDSFHETSIMITDIWGPNLNEVFEASGHSFSMQTLLLLADQLLARLQFIHRRDIAHGNLGPESFALGSPSWQSHQILLIDWKAVKRTNKSFQDDLIALGHILSYFYCGANSWDEFSMRPMEGAPPVLKAYMEHVYHSAVFDYDILRSVFRSAFLDFSFHVVAALDLRGPRAPKNALTPNLDGLLTCEIADVVDRWQLNATHLIMLGEDLRIHATWWIQFDELLSESMALLLRARDRQNMIHRIFEFGRAILDAMESQSQPISLAVLTKFYAFFGALLEAAPEDGTRWINSLIKLSSMISKLDQKPSMLYTWLQTVSYWHEVRASWNIC